MPPRTPRPPRRVTAVSQTTSPPGSPGPTTTSGPRTWRSRTLHTPGTTRTTTPTTVRATAMCKQGTRPYLQAVAAQIIGAYEVEDDDHVTFAGKVDWVCERAPVDEVDEVILRYLAGPSVRPSSGVRPATTLGSQVERRQLPTEPQQPGLLGGDGCRVGSGQVT